MFKYKAAAALVAALTTTAPFVGAFAQVAKSADLPGVQVRDPRDPNAVVPAARYISAFARYRPNVEAEVGPWRGANDNVGRIGGWRTYGKEANPDSKPEVAPGGSASPDAGARDPAHDQKH